VSEEPEQRPNLIRRVFTRERATLEDPTGNSSALEVLIAVVLGVAAVMTAFAAYQANLANGATLAAFQEGSAIYDDANQQYLEGNQQVANDVNIFTQYAIAKERGEDDVAAYIKDGLMDDPLPAATEEWEEADGEIPSAIEADAYEVAAYDEAEKLVEQGDAQFAEAKTKGEEGDNFTLATVILAVALFFGGVAGVTRSHLISVSAVLCGAVLVVGSGIYIATI
jgi:uncharacterized protein HemX